VSTPRIVSRYNLVKVNCQGQNRNLAQLGKGKLIIIYFGITHEKSEIQ